MEDEFQKRTVLCYSNFMKYIISFSIFNILLVIIENSSIIYSVDVMLDGDKILNELFTPFYFLSPHLYVEMLNEKLENQCFQIFDFNTTNEENNAKNTNLNETKNLRNLKQKKTKNKPKRLKKRTLDNMIQNETEKNETDATDEEEEEDPMVEMFKRITEEEKYFDIKFKGHILYSLDNSYCVYNKNLIYIAYSIVVLLYILLILLFFLNTRKRKNIIYTILGYILTNLINIFIRPFFIAIVSILVNRPLLYLYRGSYMSKNYQIEEMIYMVVSLIMLIFFVVFTYLMHDYINNIFCFENFPYDSFITSEENVLMFIKVCIGFKLTYDKIMGINEFSVINLIIGLFCFYRLSKTIGSAKFIVNHIYLKLTRCFLSFFCCILIILKLMNQYLNYFQEYSLINFVLEIIFILFIDLTLAFLFTPSIENNFLFIDQDDLLKESLKFFYYVNRKFPLNQKQMRDKKKEKEEFIDKIIIGHKMKCKLDDCLICNETIYNPDIKTLTLIIYSQFLECEKDFGEDEEGLALLIKLMFILQVDNKKIHRLAFNILKNLKNQNLDSEIIIKMIYLYQKCLDRLNEEDPRGLLSVKHDEVNEELLRGIKNFEDILGYIRTRTEKVELVTNKTNSLGDLFRKLNKNLIFLKNSKKYGYDMSKFLEMGVLVRLLFPRSLEGELLENIDINFIEFLEAIDKDYMENITLMLKYDFNNKTWRIKNIPKRFIEHTNYKINELLDQPLDKIFPKVLAKSRIKKLEKEVVLANPNDEKLEFKTVICDKETNIKSVKFIINVVPNLENNYSIYMRCHFHKRQLIIIDEFGNFMNGSELLYKKVGINADIVAASKGRINMYTMFGLNKKQKLEDIKIVHINTKNITEVTRDLFLIENKNNEQRQRGDDDYDDEETENVRMKATQTPMFLNAFLENQQKVDKQKEKPHTVFLQLFNKEIINDVKYYLFTVKLDEKKKDKNKNAEKKEKELKDTSTPNEASGTTSKDLISSQIKKGELTMSKIKEDEFSENQPLKEEDVLNEEEEEEKEEEIKRPENKEENNDENKKYEETKNKDYQNYVEYYNTFYDSQHSMSMTMNGAHYGSIASSMGTSMSSDIFGFLLMKTVHNESTSSKFQKFILLIGILGLTLILFGIGCIISLKIKSKTSYQLLNLLDDFNFMSLRIYSATDLFFCYSKYFQYDNIALDEIKNNTFNNYIKNNLNYKNLSINFDNLILECLVYESNQSLSTTYQFNYDSYNYFSSEYYNEKINNDVYYIHLEPSGAYSIKEDKLKNIIDLFTLTLNQISEKKEQKIYFNIKILDYTYKDITSLDYPDLMVLTHIEKYTNNEKNQFNNLINLYQHIFNFYNSYINTFQSLSSFINSTIRLHFEKLHRINEILLIIVLVVNVIFVFICFFSIVFYRKVLKNEFTNLYGLSEDTISKLQEKFKYVKELIKREHIPSSVYRKIKKLREDIEAALMKEKIHKKKKENKEKDKLMMESAGGITKNKGGGGPALKRAATQKSESLSIMTTGSQSTGSEYLQFSGAVKGLFRSSTLRAQKQVNKLNKEARKAKASSDLLGRLNFDFEMVKNFITFIIFMCVFYVVLGIIVFIVSEQNFNKVNISLDYTENFRIKYNSIFNIISAIKISIITNKKSPYTLYNGTKTPECTECVTDLMSDYTENTASLDTISSKYSTFNKIYQIEKDLEGENLCNNFYKNYNNDWISYLKNKNENYLNELINICQSITILKSNPATIFSNLMYNSRRLYNYYLGGNFSLDKRKEILDTEFNNIDLTMIIFVYPYFEYLCDNVILGMNQSVAKSYYVFTIIIFVINIIINIFMMLFIWIKIYHQIIRSVENIQLVNDSISVV